MDTAYPPTSTSANQNNQLPNSFVSPNQSPTTKQLSKYFFLLIALGIVLAIRVVSFLLSPEILLNFFIIPIFTRITRLFASDGLAASLIGFFSVGILSIVLSLLFILILAYTASRIFFKNEVKKNAIKIFFAALLLNLVVPSVYSGKFGNNLTNRDANKIYVAVEDSYSIKNKDLGAIDHTAGTLTLNLSVENNLTHPIKIGSIKNKNINCSSTNSDQNIYKTPIKENTVVRLSFTCEVVNIEYALEESNENIATLPIYQRVIMQLMLHQAEFKNTIKNNEPMTIDLVFEPLSQANFVTYIDKSITTKPYVWFPD